MPGAVSRPLRAALAHLRFGPVDLDEFDRGIRRLGRYRVRGRPLFLRITTPRANHLAIRANRVRIRQETGDP